MIPLSFDMMKLWKEILFFKNTTAYYLVWIIWATIKDFFLIILNLAQQNQRDDPYNLVRQSSYDKPH